MAIYRPPPSPFIGGWQPLAPRQLPPSELDVAVHDPPLTGSARSPVQLAIILQAWRPPPPQPWYPRYVPTELVEPPINARLWLSGILRTWDPAPPLPTLPRKLPLDATAVVERDPPFGQRAWLSAVLQAWQPGPPSALRVRMLVPVAEEEVLLNARPWLPIILRSWQIDPPRPWLGWKVHPSLEAVAEDDPPFSQRRDPSIWLAWQPLAVRPPDRRFTIHVVADDPPFAALTRVWLSTILTTWQIPAPLRPRPIAAIHAVQVNDPPFGQRLWLSAVLTRWQPGPPQPPRFLPVVVTPGAAVITGGDELLRLGTEPGATSGTHPILGGWMG